MYLVILCILGLKLKRAYIKEIEGEQKIKKD
jgi:hypothetical protein